MDQTLPLTKFLKKLGARFGSFSGYVVPLEFDGAKEEHLSVRLHCGVFDVSHMGLLEVKKDDASLSILKDVLAGRIIENKANYALVLNSHGKILDDLIVYLGDSILLCCNAANKERVLDYLTRRGLDAKLLNCVILAVQGPETINFIKDSSLKSIVRNLAPKEFILEPMKGVKLISNTGYTGEEGFEIFLTDHKMAEEFFLSLTENKVKPCGLIARDTLRLEWGLPLYGNEIDETLYPSECGFPESFNKGQVEQRFFTKFFICEENYSCIPRKGWVVKDQRMEPIGFVTSGAKTPCLHSPIGFVRIQKDVDWFTLEQHKRAVKGEAVAIKKVRALVQEFKQQDFIQSNNKQTE